MQCEITSKNPDRASLVYGSVCSGIEAASTAWHPLGWKPAFFSEIDPFPRAVLAHHYPSVPLHGDFTTIGKGSYDPIDLLVGGTPCQSFSVAGLRKGLADERGNLTLEFVRLAQRLRPRWLVWENVPGVLSIDGGRAFGSFLGALADIGYGFAYRVLDAQHFGVPQRRRRVFVVGYFGDWRPPAAVLFERESLLGDLTPSREEGKSVAGSLASRTSAGGGLGTDFECDGGLVARAYNVTFCDANGRRKDRPDGGLYVNETEQAKTVTAAGDSSTYIAHTLRGDGFDASEDGTGRGTPLVPVAYRTNAAGQVMPQGECTAALTTMTDPTSQFIAEPYTLAIRGRDGDHQLEYRQDGLANTLLTPNGGRAGMGVGAVAFAQNVRNELREMPISPALSTGGGKPGEGYPAVRQGMAVRRLTPRECERLQGFPDDYTLVPHRGKAAADGSRYKALGNSMAVPCMRFIGERIEKIDNLLKGLA